MSNNPFRTEQFNRSIDSLGNRKTNPFFLDIEEEKDDRAHIHHTRSQRSSHKHTTTKDVKNNNESNNNAHRIRNATTTLNNKKSSHSASNEVKERKNNHSNCSSTKVKHRHSYHPSTKGRSQQSRELELDSIDKLDPTSLFFRAGFHHDGPYDVIRPQRNMNNNKNAPLLAFPKDSTNNNLGGRHHNLSTTSSDTSLNNPLTRKDTVSGQLDSKAKTIMVHGKSSAGLGSTTFLDGALASKEAIKENNIRRIRTIKDNRRKSFGDFLRGDFDFTDEYNEDWNYKKEKSGAGLIRRSGTKLLSRVKSLKR